MSTRRQADILLAKADEDVYLMRAMLADAQLSDEVWGFHAQQAAEKLFKSLMASREIVFPFTHQISLLTDLLEEHGIALDEDFLSLIALTPYAAGLRYSLLDTAKCARLDRKAILACVSKLRDFVRASF
jgi:HEPN domain-containing protein